MLAQRRMEDTTEPDQTFFVALYAIECTAILAGFIMMVVVIMLH